MNLDIDLWLERRDPRIIIRDRDTGDVVMVWDSITLGRELARGDLCMEDLCDTELSCSERLGLVAEIWPGRSRR